MSVEQCECANCAMRTPKEICAEFNRRVGLQPRTAWLCGICQADYKEFTAEADKNRRGLTIFLIGVSVLVVTCLLAWQQFGGPGISWIGFTPWVLPLLTYLGRDDVTAFLSTNKTMTAAARSSPVLAQKQWQ